MAKGTSKKEQLKQDNIHRYRQQWGNYKSDKYKTKKLLKEEIRDVLVYGEFSKDTLIIIKDYMKYFGLGIGG